MYNILDGMIDAYCIGDWSWRHRQSVTDDMVNFVMEQARDFDAQRVDYILSQLHSGSLDSLWTLFNSGIERKPASSRLRIAHERAPQRSFVLRRLERALHSDYIAYNVSGMPRFVNKQLGLGADIARHINSLLASYRPTYVTRREFASALTTPDILQRFNCAAFDMSGLTRHLPDDIAIAIGEFLHPSAELRGIAALIDRVVDDETVRKRTTQTDDHTDQQTATKRQRRDY